MIFKAFVERANVAGVAALERAVNDHIAARQAEGYLVADQTAHMRAPGGRSYDDPVVLITVWMAKDGEVI